MADKDHTEISDLFHHFPSGKSEAIGRRNATLEDLEIALRAVHAEFDRPGKMPDDVYGDICSRSWKIRELAAATPA